MIDIHLLRYALAAADSGSFSRAADRFGIKQSTLSKHILYLEQLLGIALFKRSTRGVVPTDPGERVLCRARRIVADIEALSRDSRALARGEAGRLRLGFAGSLGGGDLAAILQTYRCTWPAVEIEAKESSGAHLLDALERDGLDLAVVFGRHRRPALASISYWSEPVLLTVPPTHDLATADAIYWSDLRETAFTVTAADPGPAIGAMIMARLAGPSHHPDIAVQHVSRDNLLSFATAERIAVVAGIPRLPAHVVDAPVLREVHDAFGPTTLDQGVHWRRDNDNPALKRFLELLSKRYARPIPND